MKVRDLEAANAHLRRDLATITLAPPVRLAREPVAVPAGITATVPVLGDGTVLPALHPVVAEKYCIWFTDSFGSLHFTITFYILSVALSAFFL